MLSATLGALVAPRDAELGALRPDLWLCIAVLLLMTLGLLMVASASLPMASEELGQPLYFVVRQGIFLFVGLGAARLVYGIPTIYWERWQGVLLLLAVFLLLLVLVPGVGREVNGSVRWIRLGPVNVQVSEVAKLLALIYLAGYLQRHGKALAHSTLAMVRPLGVLALLSLLLLLEPDFGSAAVLLAVALGMIFLAGVNVPRFIAFQTAIGIAMVLLIVTSEYRLRRLLSFLDPWQDPFNSGFQLTHSLIAVGRGGFDGVGLGNSVQKLFYLPEAHTDFIFAILAEELGFLGVLAVLGLYALLVYRAFAISAQAQRLNDAFASYLAAGIGLWFGIQVLINIGVNTGALPTKGLTLPLLSYGGSSLVVMCIALGILLRIGAEMTAIERQQSAAADSRSAGEVGP